METIDTGIGQVPERGVDFRGLVFVYEYTYDMIRVL